MIVDILNVSADALSKVHVASWKQAYEGIITDDYLRNLSVEKRTKEWVGWLEEGAKGFAFLECDRVVGFLTYLENDDESSELDRLYIHPRNLRQGIGKSLLAAYHNKVFPEYGHSILHVVRENAGAIAFYKKYGYVEDGVAKQRNVLGAIVNAQKMVKALSESSRLV